MPDPQPGSKVAKELNVYLGQLYDRIKKGKLKNYKIGGYPEGKGIEVDLEEARAAMSSTRKRGGKGSQGPKAGSKAHAKADPVGAETARRVRGEDFPVGTLISFKPFVPRINVHTVTGRYRSLVYMDRNPGAITDTLHWTDTARALLAKGIAKIERPEAILGMVMFHWISNNQLDLAVGLEQWMEKAGLVVTIPEPIVIDVGMDDEPEAEEEQTDEEE